MIRRFISVFASLAIVLVSVLGAVSSTSAYSPMMTAFNAVGAPTNLTLVGGVYTNDATPTFAWNRVHGATWYEVLMNDGEWRGVGNTNRYTVPKSLPDGWYTFYLRAHNAGNVSTSASVTFEIDTQGPAVSAVTPTSTKAGVATRVAVRTSGESAAKYCALYVNGTDVGGMTKASTEFRKDFTFATTGSHDVFARCVDYDGNTSNGPVTRVSVSRAPVVCYDYCDGHPVIAPGTLVKTACGAYAPKSDSCHSVSYYGDDGKLHAFPSETVYKSWYGSSYAAVNTISTWHMNDLRKGENVTMRPGTYLVKFSGSTTVYAVEKGAVLRPIANEAVARAIYGSNWVSTIASLSSTVKSDYTIGSTIRSSSDYSKSRAYYSVTSIDNNF